VVGAISTPFPPFYHYCERSQGLEKSRTARVGCQRAWPPPELRAGAHHHSTCTERSG